MSLGRSKASRFSIDIPKDSKYLYFNIIESFTIPDNTNPKRFLQLLENNRLLSDEYHTYSYFLDGKYLGMINRNLNSSDNWVKRNRNSCLIDYSTGQRGSVTFTRPWGREGQFFPEASYDICPAPGQQLIIAEFTGQINIGSIAADKSGHIVGTVENIYSTSITLDDGTRIDLTAPQPSANNWRGSGKRTRKTKRNKNKFRKGKRRSYSRKK